MTGVKMADEKNQPTFVITTPEVITAFKHNDLLIYFIYYIICLATYAIKQLRGAKIWWLVLNQKGEQKTFWLFFLIYSLLRQRT